MRAIKVQIEKSNFLFPDGFDFIFPDYVNEHLPTIREYISASHEMVAAMKSLGSTDTTNLQKRIKLLKSELGEFKSRTGIIGFPFNMHDVDLYVVDRQVHVVSFVNLDT